MKIQTVFFDMGGTIETYGYTPALRLEATAELRRALLSAGIDPAMDDVALCAHICAGLERYKRASIASMDELPPQQVWREYIFPERPEIHNRLDGIAEQLAFLVETRYYWRALRPEVPAVIAAIHQMGLKIGLISNVNSRGQAPAGLRAHGLIDYFDPIVLSSEYGRRKPDPAIFHHAARLANTPTGACLYVGDRVARDIEGARRAGFGKAVLIHHDYDHGERDDGPAPDAVIDSMTELLDLLNADRRRPDDPPPPGRLRAFIFDAGDVLYYRAARGVGFAAFLKELGLETGPQHLAQKKEAERLAYRGQISHDEYRTAVLRLYGVTDPALVKRGKQILIEDDANVSFFDGVRETLLALKAQGYLLAIVTDTANTLSAKLRWFERGGFGHVWDAITSSIDVGVRKPDPQIYHAALRQLGVTPDQAVFVGHRAAELDGARAVGMRTVAFNPDPDARGDLAVERFADLLTLPVEAGR